MSGDGRNESELKRFEQFVSEILTVTKDDIKKVEDEAKAVIDPERAPEAEEAED